MATESGATAAASAAEAAIASGNWEQRSEASDAQHLVGNSGRGDTLGGRHQHKRDRPLSLDSIDYNSIAAVFVVVRSFIVVE